MAPVRISMTERGVDSQESILKVQKLGIRIGITESTQGMIGLATQGFEIGFGERRHDSPHRRGMGDVRPVQPTDRTSGRSSAGRNAVVSRLHGPDVLWHGA